MPYTAEHCSAQPAGLSGLRRRCEGLDLAFLDGPGGSQVPTAVIEAIADFYASCNVNTHGNFPPSREVDRRMKNAREIVATFLGAESAECISFGQNMTTLNFALSAAIGRTLNPGDEVLITQLDHEANRGPWLRLRERGVVIQEVRLKESGVLDTDDMAAKISARTKLFALGASSNALGTVNDIAPRAAADARGRSARWWSMPCTMRRIFQSMCARWTRIFCCARATNSTARMSECCTRNPAHLIVCLSTD